MIGVIERVKNSVLLKCSTLNEDVISKTLINVIDEGVYHFAEDLMSLISDMNFNLSEDELRSKTSDIIKVPIEKKIKRKLFIDSLALQITNDSYVEDYFNKEINLNDLKSSYIKELNVNKSSNQLNMTEDLNINKIIEKLRLYVDELITNSVRENVFLVNAINSLIDKTKNEIEQSLEQMINTTDLKYLDILVNELMENSKEENIEMEEGEENMIEKENVMDVMNENINNINKFDKYDDMTLFNKMILSLNTKEERLSRKESGLEKRKTEVDERLSATNKNIEANIERENKLSQRRLELNSKEVELNSKLSEAEVIFLNMKPLIKGLNKIKVSDEKGGNDGE